MSREKKNEENVFLGLNGTESGGKWFIRDGLHLLKDPLVKKKFISLSEVL
jgi:hypothetical protein